jgi:hypothetical protein
MPHIHKVLTLQEVVDGENTRINLLHLTPFSLETKTFGM